VKRYACVHGHFYQPPRDNPWTGAVERQPSAGRDHDWNARVARECYVPNGEARVLDGSGRIVDLVDNYEWISFNYGPTLLAWFEKAHPHAYARLQEADRLSAARLEGHGNAIAQAFHHTILPLADPRDRRTEILWGLRDFEKRFGRKSEGMWLPECAVDDATMADLAAAGVKFVILEPHQAQATRPLAAGGEWTPAEGALRPGTPYLWRDAAGASLAVFFYDGPLSRAVAFERAMSDSRAYATRLAEAVEPAAEDGLALAATDGESYGHHEAFAEMGLAHLMRYALPEKGVTPVNLGWFLEKHPPRREVKLADGGTSWSCAHGVERWRDDCGCGGLPGRHQRWRKPLRESLERLRGRLADLYEREAAGLLSDPWAARDAYVAVVLDRSEESVRRYLEKHAPSALDGERRVRVLRLLEMQRHGLMMFTSCGWFFDELSRLEPVQVLLYAARALELARLFGADFEPELVAGLKLAPSNEPYGDGARIWDELVRPHVHTFDHVAAHYAVSLLFEDQPPAEIQGRAAKSARLVRRAENGLSVAAGRAEFVEPATGERWGRCFFAAILSSQRVQAFICGGDLPEDRFEALLADAAQGGESCPLPPGRLFRLRDLRPDERERVLALVLKRRLSRWETIARDAFEETLPLVEQFKGLGLPPPPGLGEEARLALSHELGRLAESFASGAPGALPEFRAALARGRASGVEALTQLVEGPWERGLARVLEALERGFADADLIELREAAELADAAGLNDWRARAQTRFFRLRRTRPDSALSRQAAAVLGLAA